MHFSTGTGSTSHFSLSPTLPAIILRVFCQAAFAAILAVVPLRMPLLLAMWAGHALAALASANDVRAFYIGHSLISDIPDMVQYLARSAGKNFSFKEQFIPGAPLHWQWKEGRQHRGEPQFQANFDQALPGGGFNVLILTDSVPRGGEAQEAESAEYLARFHAFALEHNPQCQVYYYETWHHITSGTPQNSEYDNASPHRTLLWRERLDADAAMWDSIVARANQINSGKAPPIRLIPAGRALARFEDAVRAGRVPGITDARAYFDDKIHLNPYGKYLVACVHYATLYQQSPEGLHLEVKNRWGASYWNTPNWQQKQWPPPSPEAVRLMQQIAWETVKSHNSYR